MSRAAQVSAGCTWRSIDAPADLAALHDAHPARYPHLLESVAHGTPPGRFDILFAFPGRTLVLDGEGRLHEDGRAIASGDFLSVLDRRLAQERAAGDPNVFLPFRGGWFLFLSYELVAQIEARLAGLRREPELPVACATRFPAAVIRDREGRRVYLVCEAGQEDLLDAMQRDLDTSGPRENEADPGVAVWEEEPPEVFLSGMQRIQEYIAAGDVFQVNLSRGWRAALTRAARPVEIYRRLRAANPAPFSGLMTFPAGAIISSSPERLVEVRNRTVRTRPIAGTFPRGADHEEDARRARELLAHPKERAEHVMLIDLERNDLGRVCEPGSVRVGELMVLESYRHVHHIVSEVCGELRREATPADLIRAVFPGGTITGCPKVRCMEIIAELERSPRGAYTGSMGYLNRDGSLDLNILIRTLTHAHGRLSFRAGAGIVADSIPERELDETRAKARGLLAALGGVVSEPGRVLINGEWQDCVSVRDRGFQYGDGVFETIAVRADAPLRFERHLDRLELGCARLGIPVPDRRALRDEASRTCAGIERAVLKLVLTRGPSDRGYAPPRAPSPTRVLALSDWPAYPPAYAEDGVAVRVCAQRLSLNPRLAGIKHLNRLEQVLARAEWGDEYAEGLMLNARDEVVDGTMSNVFAVLDGMLVTPDIIDAGVAGIMRGRVLERAAAAGVPCQVRPLALSELRRASELFLTNSLIGIWPVRRLDEHALRPGPVTRALQRALEEA